MNKQLILTGIIVLFSIGILTLIVSGSLDRKNEAPVAKNVEKSAENTPIFFYGNTCPHCADVEEWMDNNNIEQKMTIVKKEVYENTENAEDLTKAAQTCGLPADSIGVPFLYTKGKCIVGTPNIINYLSTEATLLEASDSAERNGL